MLKITAQGKIAKGPEIKQSAKGVPYAKLMLEVPQSRGTWPKRLYLTAFGAQVSDCERLQHGYEVTVEAEPSARGYLDKMGKPTAVLEGILRTVRIVNVPAPAPIMEAPLDEMDIPF
jgi:hypothetical protein